MNDNDYMRRAVELAKRGCGFVSPNPMVGAVIVKDGRIIGEGWHARYGDLHAERAALNSCTESPAGGVMYVTLEPCCHRGKQPPCTDAVIASGVKRAVIGSLDPNPAVSGGGIKALREHGIETETGVLKEECDELNFIFFHYIKTGIPYATVKYAMTMDGKTASYTGASKWITGETARERVHEDRRRYSAVMTGVDTVLADDPLLTCRIEGGRDPLRIICDSRLRTPLESKIVKTAASVPTVIATCVGDAERFKEYEGAGCRILTVPQKEGRVDLESLFKTLGGEGIDGVLIESGGTLSWSVLKSGLARRVQAYIAPKLLGGAGAKSPVGGAGIAHPKDAIPLKNSKVTRLGEDFLIESEVDFDVHRDN